MPHYAYKVHSCAYDNNVPGQILSQVPATAKPERFEDINKTLKNETFKESTGSKSLAGSMNLTAVAAGCKSKPSKGCTKSRSKRPVGSKCSSKGTKGTNCNKITTLDELRMKYSK